eukprot:1288496-Prymnesium_polylepis.1
MLAARPWVHYVPIAADFSDLGRAVRWARAHDREVRAIRDAHNALGARVFRRRAIREYLATLVHCYAPLLR